MRIVTKVNLTLLFAVAAAAALNAVVLQATVLPSFVALEDEAARRNEARVEEALGTVEDQVGSTTRDYAFWDETYEFLRGERPDYAARNMTAESLKALGLDYVALIDTAGRVVLDEGYVRDETAVRPSRLLGRDRVSETSALRAPFEAIESRSGLVMGPRGLVAVSYAPVQTSTRGGVSPGVILFGRLVDVDALNAVTQVPFSIEPFVAADATAARRVRTPDTIELHQPLLGLDGRPVAVLVTRNARSVSALGQTAVWSATALMILSMLVVVAGLGLALRRIAVRRIERMRAHLSGVAASGDLVLMAADGAGDELSETVASFNAMARQLADLRNELRRSDYQHGAADQAAGLLHNIRNAMSPVAAIAWDLERREDAPWKSHLSKALDQLGGEGLEPGRAEKLQRLALLSAGEALKAAEARRADLRALHELIRHVEEILREQDRMSQVDRVPEPVGLADAVGRAVERASYRPNLVLRADVEPGAAILGHRVVLDQILDNLLVNAAQAIEAAGRAEGRIEVRAAAGRDARSDAVEITVRDDGDGIPADHLGRIFANGFSTRSERSGGRGLHWCANAARAMGGGLSAESGGSGQGATLRLTLPCAPARHRAAA